MSNCYSILTAARCVPCSKEAYTKLSRTLRDTDDGSGLLLEFRADDPDDSGVFVFTEEFFNPEEVPQTFLAHLGMLLMEADMEYLELNVARIADKQEPGSHDGSHYRIYADGELRKGTVHFEKVLAHPIESPGTGFYRTVYTIEVLSQQPPNPDWDVAGIHHAITEGDCSGELTEIDSREILRTDMAECLDAQGSDPSFLISDWGEQEGDDD